MAFSQSKREIEFGGGTFFPGPGHYEMVHYPEIVDRIEAQFIQKKPGNIKDSRSNWGHADRFRATSAKNQKTDDLGPGEYLGISSWVKDVKKKQPVRNAFESHPRKVLTIPSIPSHGQNFGYQETPDGMLVMLQDPNANDRVDLGPGSYDIKLDITKEKFTKGYSFSKSKQRAITTKEEEAQPKNPEIGPGSYEVFVSRSAEEKKEEKEKAERAARRKPFKREHPKKDNPEDEQPEVPGPGHYHNPFNYSTFQPKVKHPNYQFFDSKEARFTTLFKGNDLPGPGHYTANEINDAKQRGQTFLAANRFQDNRPSVLPGPGTYSTKSMFETNALNDDLIKKIIVEKPPAFGTSTRRFVEGVDAVEPSPGPGYYNVASKKKKKKKRIIKYINPSILSPAEIVQTHIPQSVRGRRAHSELDKFYVDRPKGYRQIDEPDPQDLKNSGPNSVFVSKSKRFNAMARTDITVGPGSHNVRNDNFTYSTFNREKDVISKAKRESGPIGRQLGTEHIGPGYYDPELNLVRPNKLVVKIPADKKYAVKSPLFV